MVVADAAVMVVEVVAVVVVEMELGSDTISAKVVVDNFATDIRFANVLCWLVVAEVVDVMTSLGNDVVETINASSFADVCGASKKSFYENFVSYGFGKTRFSPFLI